MKKIELKSKFVHNEQEKSVTWIAPIDLLLTGFKFSYLSPERLEEIIFSQLQGIPAFQQDLQSNCLEEGILNAIDEGPLYRQTEMMEVRVETK